MIENNRQDNLSPNQSVPSEVPQLFDEFLDRARRQLKIERENARTRSTFAKTLHSLLITAAMSVVLTIAYGIYNFPDAPLRQKDNREYVGKSGKLHTKQEFENFLLWEKAMLITFSTVFIFAFAFHVADSREKN